MQNLHSAPKLFPESGRYGSAMMDNPTAIAERITCFPLKEYRLQDLIEHCQQNGQRELILLDQKVKDIEKLAERKSYGYEYQDENVRIVVIDHHVDDAEFSSLSTGNLVLRYLEEHSLPGKELEIGITHKDCDSLVSALMMVGALPAEPELGNAVLAADHTGIENPISDLLQAIEGPNIRGKSLSKESLAFSIQSLGRMLSGRKLDDEASQLLNSRKSARENWEARLKDFHAFENGTYAYVFRDLIDHDPCPEFLPALVPEAKLFLVFHNPPDDHFFLQVRAVRGLAAGEELRIDHDKFIKRYVPGFGGRKDAGSNRRGGISFPGDPLRASSHIDAEIPKLFSTAS